MIDMSVSVEPPLQLIGAATHTVTANCLHVLSWPHEPSVCAGGP